MRGATGGKVDRPMEGDFWGKSQFLGGRNWKIPNLAPQEPIFLKILKIKNAIKTPKYPLFRQKSQIFEKSQQPRSPPPPLLHPWLIQWKNISKTNYKISLKLNIQPISTKNRYPLKVWNEARIIVLGSYNCKYCFPFYH